MSDPSGHHPGPLGTHLAAPHTSSSRLAHTPRIPYLPQTYLSLCGILLQFGTRAEFLSNITFKHPGFCTYSCCSSPAAPWHHARPEVWARVAPSSSQKSTLAGQRAPSVWAGHTSTTVLSGASLSPGHLQCASMQTEALSTALRHSVKSSHPPPETWRSSPKSSESTG